jgi:hypothetical protein
MITDTLALAAILATSKTEHTKLIFISSKGGPRVITWQFPANYFRPGWQNRALTLVLPPPHLTDWIAVEETL